MLYVPRSQEARPNCISVPCRVEDPGYPLHRPTISVTTSTDCCSRSMSMFPRRKGPHYNKILSSCRSLSMVYGYLRTFENTTLASVTALKNWPPDGATPHAVRGCFSVTEYYGYRRYDLARGSSPSGLHAQYGSTAGGTDHIYCTLLQCLRNVDSLWSWCP